MRLRSILIAVAIIVLVVLNSLWGNAISWMLCIAIISGLSYYLLRIVLERSTLRQVAALGAAPEAKAAGALLLARRQRLLVFAVMTVVFISSIICIRNVVMPRDTHPYFYNNEYHALSNKAITFANQLKLHRRQVGDDDKGSMTLSLAGNNAQLSLRDFYTPVIAYGSEHELQLLNPIYDKAIGQNLTISQGATSISISMANVRGFWQKIRGKKGKTIYTIKIASSDATLGYEEHIKLPYSDEYSIEGDKLREGMSLYTLLFSGTELQAPRSESLQILQRLLQGMGTCYLLVNKGTEQEAMYFFPAKDFVDNGFKLSVDGTPLQAKKQIEVTTSEQFYLGFHNQEHLLRVGTYLQSSGTPSAALIFDHPPLYWLSAPDEQQQLGYTNNRFLTNDIDQVVDGSGSEGYYFNNYGLYTDHAIQGTLSYLVGRPTDSLMAKVVDANTSATAMQVKNKFELKAQDGKAGFAFEIRDFSNNGFSFQKLLIYAAMAYLGMLAVLLFFGGKNLARVEPVIFITIYALIILRMIMYWRLATFPPLEHIGKYELERTIIGFDFNFGIKWPLSLTIVWLYLFLGILVLWRLYAQKLSTLTLRLVARFQLKTNKGLLLNFAKVMGTMLLIFIINSKILHFEIFERFLAIIIPLILYCGYASISNKYYTLRQDWVPKKDRAWLRWVKSYPYYFINNPAFMLSLITLVYFGITDRGFAVLFLLFLILKNILFSFLKKPYDSSTGRLWTMLRANNYWVFGFLALVVYLVVLAYKPLFYYALMYAVYVIAIILVGLALCFYLFKHQNTWLWKVACGIAAFFMVLVAVPQTRHALQEGITHQVRHVQYRVSILHQPISSLLLQNEYSSFSTRKIIETAENQWFINSYISKEYDNSRSINLRPYNRVGVNYNTQTRDVVLPRFVIGEMGNMVMYLLLILTLLPLVIFLISYQFVDEESRYYKMQHRSYAAALPLILFFTISLFVWLTATNRFVFFGQDFPFLSLTSRLSVVLPLLLFGFTLVQNPKVLQPQAMHLRVKLARYAVFFILIGAFALITVKPNELNSKNFSVVVDHTQRQIDQQLNALLLTVQDSLGSGASYLQTINALQKNDAFQAFVNDSLSDPYTQSIIANVLKNPYAAFQVNSPIYMQYDGDTYTALYNQHFYLELPAVENQKVWHGNIVEKVGGAGPETAILTIDGGEEQVQLPYFGQELAGQVQIGVLPSNWLPAGAAPTAIINVQKGANSAPTISIYQGISSSYQQQSTSFATAIGTQDLVRINTEGRSIPLAFSTDARRFAINKWVNGKYQIFYPSRPKNLWIYHFANAVKSIYDNGQDFRKDFEISLDLGLNTAIEKQIHDTYDKIAAKNKRFKFAVIAADGEGRIRLMQDLNANRKYVDANDQQLIYELKQQQFFYSNIRNERDQWGNACLLAMQLGPGSSIKPIIAATVASQVNAGWEHLVMSPPVQAEYDSYAGFRLSKPWHNGDHYRGPIGLRKFLEASSNYYESVLLFLGSYPKSAFEKNGTVSIANVLAPAGSNAFPGLSIGGRSYSLASYNGRNGIWPRTDYTTKKKGSFFGNENSILANGLELNANLQTKDKNKNSAYSGGYGRTSLIDSALDVRMQNSGGASYLWSMPEPGSFLQSLRAKPEIHENFNIGLKTATLGGYPYQLSPFKMLEMYGSMMSQNRLYRLSIGEHSKTSTPWYIDSTWTGTPAFNTFMASQIFGGMHDVVYGGSGTAGKIRGVGTRNPGLYVYAKTGTINEEGRGLKSSRRFLVTISNLDLEKPENIGKARLFTFYFMVDYNQDFDWGLLNNIIDRTLKSKAVSGYLALATDKK